MDYMLRDSHHAGVSYGRYDLNRIIATVKFVRKLESDDEYTVGIAGDGIHAAEGLIIARYMMFTQVYFHKTRVIYDYHLIEALKEILKDHGGSFPSLDSGESVQKYLKWDDWRVFGELAKLDTEHGAVLRERKHYRLVEETPEVPSLGDRAWIENLRDELEKNGMRVVQRDAEKSWYKFDNPGDEILVENEYGPVGKKVIPLSHRSSVVKGLPPVRQSRLYVKNDQRKKAEKIAQAIKPKV